MTVPFPRLQLPGSLAADKDHRGNQTPPARRNSNAGRCSHLFQPPRSPTTPSPFYLSREHSDDQEIREAPSRSSRKRSRTNSVTSINSDFAASWAHLRPGKTTSMEPRTPASFVNTKYRLAGGLDTPTMATDAAFERESGSNYSDTAYRRSWASPTASRMVDSSEDGYFPRMPASFPVENHGRNRAHTIASGQGWGKAVYEVVGEVAGKVWEFCRSSAFMGFYAGGGKGYHLNQPHSFQESGVPSWQGLDHDTSLEREMSLDSTPVPGGYPSERQIVEQAQQDTASPRPAKRLQTGKGTGGIRANWVIVPVASTPVSREASPSRIPLRKAPAVSPPKRVAASPRRAVTSRASRRPGLGSPRTSYVSQASQPGQLSGKQASFASPRSPATSAPSRPTTPASLEAKRFAAQRRREEKEADASIKKLNQQLKAMIREGKEALGSTIEIEDDFSNASLAKDYEMDMEMEDEGFSEAMHMGYDRMPY